MSASRCEYCERELAVGEMCKRSLCVLARVATTETELYPKDEFRKRLAEEAVKMAREVQQKENTR